MCELKSPTIIYFLDLFIPYIIIYESPSKHCIILSCGSVFTGIYMTCIYVDPISIPILLPSSIKSCSCLIILYLTPYLTKNPTPLLPLTARSKFWPTHSYPIISISVFPFRWVSDTAKTSGFSSYKNYIILYFLATIPLTFTCIIFITLFSFIIIYGFVILKYSSSFVCLDSFLSSLTFLFRLSCY